MRIVNYITVIAAASILGGCAAPIQMNQIEGLHAGMTPTAVATMVNRQPKKVAHAQFRGRHYLAQFYPMEVGTRTEMNTTCSKNGCT
ncbi:MAG: hypothetical protein COB66_07625, partial [Coxiella sp. (in: Bacteria)]